MSLPNDWAAVAARSLTGDPAPAVATAANKSPKVDPNAGRPALPERLAGTIFAVVPDGLWERAGAQVGKPVTRTQLSTVWQLLGFNGLDAESWYAAAAIDAPDPKRPKPPALSAVILDEARRRMAAAFGGAS